MDTEKYRLKDILTIGNGKDHKELNDGPYPVYGSGGFMRNADSYLYDGESVLLPRKGTLSNIQYVNGKFWTVDTCYYTKINTSIVIPYYLFRLLRSYDLSGLDSGASIPSMTSKTYYEIKINLPKLDVQKRISDLLLQFDKLIEINNKKIKILEQMAEEIYKEWFVRFRFPGHETAEFENGIPKGWEIATLERIATFQNGYAFKSDELLDYPVEESFDVFKQGHICRGGGLKQNGTKSWIPKSQCSKLEKYILHKNDILMAMTDMKDNVAILGNTALVPIDKKYILNQRVGLLRPTHYKCIDFEYIYFLTNSKNFIEDLRGRANRGVQVNLSAVAIKNSKIIVPPKTVNVLFSSMVNPYLEMIYNLSIQNNSLAKQRDLLLPRLMCGKLEV